MRCHQCGYDLRGSSKKRCPECGQSTKAIVWSPDVVKRWLLGALLPLPICALGLRYMLTQHGVLPGRSATITLVGANAVALGGAIISIGILFHARYFWGESRTLAPYSDAAQAAAMIAFIANMAFVGIRLTKW